MAVAVAIGVGSATPLAALDPERAITQYVRESWITRDGAPTGTITGITQTANGYLWLGTESDGLVRFDGVTFVHEDGPDTLFGRRVDRITSLLCGRDETLWVGTNFGLARFKNGRWTAFDRGEAKDVFGLYEARRRCLVCPAIGRASTASSARHSRLCHWASRGS
jgi:ligand-binding sensor domain-containing protein